MDYSLCDQTVTVYGLREGGLQRWVAENCYLVAEPGMTESIYGKSRENRFLLIIPGDVDLQPGDRVYEGIGPETVDWQTFVPAFTQGLYEIGRVKKQMWEDEITHVEGRERL